MIAQCKMKYIKISPRKLRLIADLIRGKNVNKAINLLALTSKRGSKIFVKALKNATNNLQNIKTELNYEIDNFFVKEVYVDEGPTLKRWLPRAMGRATPINKRTSHLTLKIEEESRIMK